MTGGSLLRVLTVDRTANDAEPLIDMLRSAGYGVFPKHVPNGTELLAELANEEWDLVLCGKDVEGLDVAETVRYLQDVRTGTAVIVVYDEAHTDNQACVVEALQAGASDAVSRANPMHLQLVVNREIQRLVLHRAHQKATHNCVELQERCTVLLESSGDPVAYIHQGMHVYANGSYARIFGYKNLEDLLGLPIMNMIVPAQQGVFKEFLRQCSPKPSGNPSFEATCVNAGAEEFSVRMELAAVTYEGENCLQVIIRPSPSKVGRGNPENSRYESSSRDSAHASSRNQVGRNVERDGGKIQSRVAAGKNVPKSQSVSELRDALDRGRLSLLFQPIVSLQGENTAMYEAYLRVLNAEGKPVNTDELFFGPEDVNTATKLDEWIVEAVLKVLRDQKKQKEQLRFFLRLSDYALRNELLLLSLREKLRAARLAGQCLTLQISEKSAIQETKNVRAFLSGLKPLGCRSAIEQVGLTGKTLDHVKELPVDYVKLHVSLCQGMMKGKEGRESMATIVQFAKSMGFQTVATGVQEAACLALLWQSGIDFAQGHCIQEPSEVLEYDFGNEN